MTSRELRQEDRVPVLFNNRNRIIVMGVVNTTPDSFSDGGQFFDANRAVDYALQLVAEGADIIDVGGESTRPGADPVGSEEEMRRVIPVIERLAAQTNAPISIDTYKESVARAALTAGATIVNDISGLTADPRLAQTAAEFGAGLILMHKRGDPTTMQSDTHYEDLIAEISLFLREAISKAEAAGVDPAKIMIDPGIGFGKDLAGNVQIINSVGSLTELGKPVLIGASRKAFIGRITGAADPAHRLHGSLAAAVAAVIYGAAAVRVHDVKETREAVDVAIQLRRVK
jgi:dihydropteroate synthase